MAGQEHTQPRPRFERLAGGRRLPQCSGSVDERGYTLRSLRPASRRLRQVETF
jgi:hypothetical protein